MDNSTDFREGRAAFDDHEGFDPTWAIAVGVTCVGVTVLVIIGIKVVQIVRSRRHYQSFTSSKEDGTVQDSQSATATVTPNNNSFTSLQWRFNARRVETGLTPAGEKPLEDRKSCQSKASYDTQCSNKDNFSYVVDDDGYGSGNSRIHSGNDLANASSRCCWHLSKEDEPIYQNSTSLGLQYTMNNTLYDYPPSAPRAVVQHPVVETHYDYPPSAMKPTEPVYDYPPSANNPIEPVYDYPQHKSTPGESIYVHPRRSPAPVRSAAVQESIYDYPQPGESIYDHPPRGPALVRSAAVEDSVYDYPQQHQNPHQNPHFMYSRPSPNTYLKQTVPDQSVYDRPSKYSEPVVPPRREKY